MGDNVVAEAGVAGLALHLAVAGQAAVGVVGEDEGEDGLARLFGLTGIRAYDHAVGDLGGARELKGGRALDLHQAGATAGVGREAVDVAEVGDEDAGVLDDLNQGCAHVRLDLPAVKGQLGHGAT
ncbi:MAG: hypothetical protein V3S20_04685 [Dehalococcoidia bacterium]